MATSIPLVHRQIISAIIEEVTDKGYDFDSARRTVIRSYAENVRHGSMAFGTWVRAISSPTGEAARLLAADEAMSPSEPDESDRTSIVRTHYGVAVPSPFISSVRAAPEFAGMRESPTSLAAPSSPPPKAAPIVSTREPIWRGQGVTVMREAIYGG